MIIDVHAHYYPPRYLELIGRPGLPPATPEHRRAPGPARSGWHRHPGAVRVAGPAYLPDIPHLGGTIPFLLARVTRKSAAQITRSLRGMYYDTVSGSAEALASTCHLYGAGRLLFDYPYRDEPQFRDHLSYLSDAGLDRAELAQIKGGTAAALLGVSAVTT